MQRPIPQFADVTPMRLAALAPMRGRDESRYMRAVDPDAPRAAWIRHTHEQGIPLTPFPDP